MMKYVVIRNVTPNECEWLEETIKKGTEVYKYYNHTYGCISPNGIAVSKEHGEIPFFELPRNALQVIHSGE
jgi:hypothetical protein